MVPLLRVSNNSQLFFAAELRLSSFQGLLLPAPRKLPVFFPFCALQPRTDVCTFDVNQSSSSTFPVFASFTDTLFPASHQSLIPG